MPTNLYGPVTILISKLHMCFRPDPPLHEAKAQRQPEVVLWGTGTPRREFLHVDDLAKACVFLMQNYDEKQFVNVGVGEDMAISELAKLVAGIVEYSEGSLSTPPSPTAHRVNCLT